MTFEKYCVKFEDEITEAYVEAYFAEGYGHGGDFDPCDNEYFNECLWLDCANDLWYAYINKAS